MALSPTSIPAVLQGAAGLGRSMNPALKIDNRSSSSSAANVSVAPVISVVSGGSAGDLTASGSASGSPSANSSSPAGGYNPYGSMTSSLYGNQSGGAAREGEDGDGKIFGIDPMLWLLLAGGALLFLGKGKKKGGGK